MGIKLDYLIILRSNHRLLDGVFIKYRFLKQSWSNWDLFGGKRFWVLHLSCLSKSDTLPGFCNISMCYLGHGSTSAMPICCYVECIVNLSYTRASKALNSIPPKHYLLNMGCSMWRRNYRFKTHAKIIRAFETARTVMWKIYAKWWKDVLILAMHIWIALEDSKYRHWTRRWQAKW